VTLGSIRTRPQKLDLQFPSQILCATYVFSLSVFSAALWVHICRKPVADEPPKCKAGVRPHVCSLTAGDRYCGPSALWVHLYLGAGRRRAVATRHASVPTDSASFADDRHCGLRVLPKSG
jgi:hypothetical protein